MQIPNPNGVVSLRSSIAALERQANEMTQPRWGCCYHFLPVTQGSREARQPWALLLNRFAVKTRAPALEHQFAK
jgi:hypothetical protein